MATQKPAQFNVSCTDKGCVIIAIILRGAVFDSRAR